MQAAHSSPEHHANGGHYTHGHEQTVLASHSARTAASSAPHLLPHLRPDMTLLDVGFGPGTITLDLAELVAPGQVVAVENTRAPLATARANARARGDERTRFMLGDVMDLAFPDDSFDAVHAHQVLQHLEDPVGALREMARVCRPEGWVAARDADYAAMSWYPEFPGLEQWRSLYREIAQDNGGEPDAGRHMRAWAHAAGLREPRVTTSSWSYADTESCRWWGNSWAERVSGRAFTEQALRVGASHEDVDAIARAWRRWADEPDAFFLLPHVEVLARGSSTGTAPTPGPTQ